VFGKKKKKRQRVWSLKGLRRPTHQGRSHSHQRKDYEIVFI